MSGSKAGARCVVGCKLPHGLAIVLERQVETAEPNGTIVRRYVPVGDEVVLKGTNASNVIGGYGLTEDVDAAWFAEWLKTHADFPPVKRDLIFVHSTMPGASDTARERASVRSGFEPLDPDNPGPKLEKA